MTPVDRMVGVADGLKLHVRDWRPEGAAAVVCLPGLARTVDDFDVLASRLSSDDGGARRVVAISARGRGRSDRDPDPKRYQVGVEAADVLAVIDALSITRPIAIGTSRGGLQAMTIAAMRPGFWRGVVLNDIGPMIEPLGLKRIRDQLRVSTVPHDWGEAARLIVALHGDRFPALSADDFARWARRAWREGANGLEPACDPALARMFEDLDLDQKLPPLWPLFDALRETPLVVIRGALSDILTAETVAEMKARAPELETHEVSGEGHAPLLEDRPTQDAIERFLEGAGHDPHGG